MKPSIIQVAAGLAENDAITNMIFALNDRFRSKGYKTRILAGKFPAAFSRIAESTKNNTLKKTDFLIHHYGTGFRFEPSYEHPAERKRIMFYGITPSYFFAPYSLQIAGELDRGLSEIKNLAQTFKDAYVLSDETGYVLKSHGFAGYTRIPFTDERLIRQQRGKYIRDRRSSAELRLLVLGRVSPNKRIEDAIKTVFFLKRAGCDPKMKITGVTAPELSGYLEECRNYVRYLKLEENIEFTGPLGQNQLERLWRETDFYLTVSQHEGFCVPVIEAMARQVAVAACQFEGSAIDQTAGDAGIVTYGFDPAVMAELICLYHPYRTPESSQRYAGLIKSQNDRFNRYCDEVSLFLSGSFFDV